MDEKTAEQRRREILFHQHITAPADKLTVCRDLCGFQAQFLSNARRGLAIRCREPLADDWGRGLVKSWTIRGTIHVFAAEDLPLFLYEGRIEKRRPVDSMEADQFISLPRKRYFADYIVDLIGQGVESRDDLRARCFEAGLTEGEAQSVFDPWGGTIRYLAETGVICYRVQEKKAFRLCPPFEPLPKEQAELELVRRYFTHFGPATVRDAAYFFGVSQTRVRAWVRQLPLREMEAEGIRCYAMGGEEDVPDIPEVLFLPGFDQLMLGYQKRESLFFRQEHLRGIFNLAGIVMPVVLFRGIVVGKWKLQGRRLALTLFEKLPEKSLQQLRNAAGRTFGSLSGIHVQI